MKKNHYLKGLTIAAALFAVANAQAQTGVSTTNPHPSAELDVTSSTRGFLPPRLTATQRTNIASPAAGLVVYDTDSAALMVFNGAVWSKLGTGGSGSAGNSWNMNGNAIGGTNAVLGTTNNRPLKFISGNVIAGYVSRTSTNTALGAWALNDITDTNANNTALGSAALSLATTGTSNVAVGAAALFNENGNQNVGVGNYALGYNTQGSSNVAIGHYAMSASAGNGNTAVGHYALFNNRVNGTTGVGAAALQSNTTGLKNTAVGYFALLNNQTTHGNTALGYEALRQNGLGLDTNNTGSYSTNNTAIGANALTATKSGWNNTATGSQALTANDSGTYNAAYGVMALGSNTQGNGNAAYGTYSMNFNTTGSYNSAFGTNALVFNQTGQSNAAFGDQALTNNTTGNYNIAVGELALQTNTTGSLNTAIGHLANVGSANLTNATALGANAVVNSSNSVVLGNNANVGIGTSAPAAKLHVVGNMRLVDGAQAAGKILTSDASGNAGWQAPADASATNELQTLSLSGNTLSLSNGGGSVTLPSSGGSGTSPWSANGNDIYNSNTGRVLVGQTGAIGSARMQVREASPFSTAGSFTLAGVNGTALVATDSGTSGNPAGCVGCTGNAAIKANSRFGDALFATSPNGRGIYLKGGGSFYPAMQIEMNAGATMPALDIAGSIKIADGTQGAGKVLTSDANGNASWQPAGSGSGGGTAYTAGSGIQISGSNVISANDNSATNELQTLSLSGSTLSLSNGGGSVTLPSGSSTPTGWTYQSWSPNTFMSDISNGTVSIGTNNPPNNFRLNVFGAGSKPNGAEFYGATSSDVALKTFGRVLMNVSTPTSERLEVGGAIKIGDASATPSNGTIRYTTTDGFQGYHNSVWNNLGGASGGGGTTGNAFSVRKGGGSGATFPSLTSLAKIDFDTEDVDPANVYNPGAGNYQFTAPAAGVYQFTTTVYLTPSGTGDAIGRVEFAKNGIGFSGGGKTHHLHVAAPFPLAMDHTVTVQLAAGDVITVLAGASPVGSAPTFQHEGLGNSTFSGFRIQ